MRTTPLLLLAASTIAGAAEPIDCARAFNQRNYLAQEEVELLRVQVSRGQLTPVERERLVAVRKRRRQLLVCG